MSEQTMLWSAFGLLVVVMLAIDLGLNRKSHEISFREALTWTAVWISLALIFNIGVYYYLGKTKALEFLPVMSLKNHSRLITSLSSS